jgi:Na+-transporting NADH:ubiquinone oxidoreductase subunit NqrA
VYTQKDTVQAMIYGNVFRIRGEVHILSGSRLTDALNSKAKDFIAVTDAQILGLHEDRVIEEVAFVAVNRDAIMAIYPLEEI